jgi:hypothetical protein
MLRDVLVASINRGQFPVAILGLIIIAVILKMPAGDVSKLVFRSLGLTEHGSVLGYMFAAASAAGWYLHVRHLRRLISDEMRRISEERSEMQARALRARGKSNEVQS